MEEALIKALQTALTIIGTLAAFIYYNKKQEKKAEGAKPSTTIVAGSTNGYAKQATVDALDQRAKEIKFLLDAVDRTIGNASKDMETVKHELQEIKILEIEDLKTTKAVLERLNLHGANAENDMKLVHKEIEGAIKTIDNIDHQTRGKMNGS